MKKHRTSYTAKLVSFCLGITIIGFGATGPEPSAHGSAQSGAVMLTVSAIRHQDGSVDGHATFRDRTANTKIDIDIDCISVGSGIGGGMGGGEGALDAILSGVATKSTSPDLPENTPVAFALRDYGEGANAPPDQFTPPGPAKGGCILGMISAFVNSDHGNLVISGDGSN